MKKIIVAGSRNITDYKFIEDNLNVILRYTKKETLQLVAGGARGVDTLAKQYATSNGIAFKEFPANWDELGKAAGPIRNAEMAKYADGLIAFWDGMSTGTKNMIMHMERLNKPYKIIRQTDYYDFTY